MYINHSEGNDHEKTPTKRGELLSKMLVIATNAHAGQFDQGGNPYILHPIECMRILNTDDEELQCIAIGHDLIEDCKHISYADLREAGMTERIIEGIMAMTKVPGETYEEYVEKVKSNPDSVKVKMADLKHNSDLTRLKVVRTKDMERTNRYMSLYYELSEIDGKNELSMR